MHEALCNFLAKIVPEATIRSGGYENVDADVASMLFAPILFTCPSTLATWISLASDGEVYTSFDKLRHATKHSWPPFVGTTFHWVDAPILDQETWTAFPPPNLTAFDVDRILQWRMQA